MAISNHGHRGFTNRKTCTSIAATQYTFVLTGLQTLGGLETVTNNNREHKRSLVAPEVVRANKVATVNDNKAGIITILPLQ